MIGKQVLIGIKSNSSLFKSYGRSIIGKFKAGFWNRSSLDKSSITIRFDKIDLLIPCVEIDDINVI
jgi:hypothetical protein